MNKEKLREEIKNDLYGYVICDFITRKEMTEILEDFDGWLETAQNGDSYYYDGNKYTLTIEYKVKLWRNKEQREQGEPIFLTPINTNLDDIKAEVKKYEIENTGCVEIFEEDAEDEIIMHFENGQWT